MAREFVELFQALQSASIAHGDLQHGNILVVGGQLRLIDYDGMYVSRLAGKHSNETGHRNYQHPNRTGFDFGPGMDAFSAWVIYVSLVALSAKPELWTQFGGGDECLLFRRTDFENPENSKLFTSIETDAAIGGLASLFKSLLYLNPSQIPPLDAGRISVPLATAPPSKPSSSSSGTATGAWWHDHKSGLSAPSVSSPRTPSASSDLSFDASWVLDFVDQSSPSGPGLWRESVKTERAVAMVTGLLIGVATVLFGKSIHVEALLGMVLSAVGVNAIWWRVRYDNLSVAAELRVLEAQHREAAGRQKAALRAFKEAEAAVGNARQTRSTAEKRAFDERQSLDQRERLERERTEKHHQSRLNGLKTERADIAKREADALSRVSSALGVQRSTVQRKIQEVDAAWQAEIAARLTAIQREHVHRYLDSWTIEMASIPGISPTLKRALRSSGITSAADVSWHRVVNVRGFGDKRTNAMTTWKQELENIARRNMPTSLPSFEEQAIGSKHSSKKTVLMADIVRLEQQIRSEETSIRGQHQSLAVPIDHAIAKTQEQLTQALEAVRTKFSLERRTLEDAIKRGIQAAAEQVREREAEIQERRMRLLPTQWQSAKIQRKLRGFDGVSFIKFSRHILSFKGGFS